MLKYILLVLVAAELATAFQLRQKLQQNDVLGNQIQCLEKNCTKQYNMCRQNQTCMLDFRFCQEHCPSDQTCMKRCLAERKDQLAINLAVCAAENNCFDALESDQFENKKQTLQIQISEPAIEPLSWYVCPQYCMDLINACSSDPKCNPTITRCNFRCEANAQCNRNCLVAMGDNSALSLFDCAHQNCGQ